MSKIKSRNSFIDPYIVKQINTLPTNTVGGYPDLLIDNTEKDIVIVWSDCQPDSQVIHIQRDKLDEFIELLLHCKNGRDEL